MNVRAFVLLGIVAGVALAWNDRTRGVIVEAAQSVTDRLRELLEGFEGYRSQVYDANPPHGDWTVGIGHKVKPGDGFWPHGDVREISRERAEELFLEDTAEARAAVAELVAVPLTDNQRAALESFVFNVGRGAFANSTLLRLLNAGDYEGAAGQLDRWVYASGVKLGGLENRRAAEKEVFLT